MQRPTLKKNELYDTEIEDITNEGSGVARCNGMTVFIPDTAVGDKLRCRIVKVKSSYCYGIVDELYEQGESRIKPDCPVSRQCGGCCFRHISYDEECRIKDKFIRDSFERIGRLFPEYLPFMGCENTDNYRNKAQYPVAELNGRAVCGFYARRSHRVVEYHHCRLQPEIFLDILETIMAYVNIKKIPAYNEVTLQGLLRHIFIRRGEHSGEIMVCLVVTSLKKAEVFGDLPPLLVSQFKDIKTVVLNENPKNTNVILGTKLKPIYGSGEMTDVMCGNRIKLSPLSFYQVNTLQAERLYKAAETLAELDKDDVLLDLYCGAGTIGLSMAAKVKRLMGVEMIPQAIENAKQNALANGIDNAEFICADAKKAAAILYDKGVRPDVIIADPARKGCDREALEYMSKMSPKRIVMISCNHTTAARDCAILGELGYKTEKVMGVDMFPRTGHVETVCLLTHDPC